MSTTSSTLLEPIRVGEIDAPNRIFMAPLTRNRASQPGDVPTEMNAEYYRQRASAGLLITEATQISPVGKGYAWTPGIFSEAQIAGWKLVTDAVHQAGGRIALQLWHVGRISHVSLLPEGEVPVAPSAIRAEKETFIETGFVPVSKPRALATDELPGVVEQFRQAAENAKTAGFDGVEIHGANGYLLDQFTRSGSNVRDDGYGGDAAARVRFPVEVAEAVAGVFGAGRVGYRISPTGNFNDMHDEDPAGTFGLLARRLGELKLAYLHNVESFGDSVDRDEAVIDTVRERFLGAGGGVYVANGSLGPDEAAARISSGKSGAVAFGKLYISNPDLVERIAQGGPYNEWDQGTFYGGAEAGYTDYPSLEEVGA